MTVSTRRCGSCNAPRPGAVCWKCSTETFIPASGWIEPTLPDIGLIREHAKQMGYAIGIHGSQERDFDLIAAPWSEHATDATSFIRTLAEAINACVVDIEHKPLGRVAASLQVNGYYKIIDLSVCPRVFTTVQN